MKYTGRIRDILEQKAPQTGDPDLSILTRGIEELGHFQRADLDGEPVLFLPRDLDGTEKLGDIVEFSIPGSDLVHVGLVRDVVTSHSLRKGDYGVLTISPVGVKKGDEPDA